MTAPEFIACLDPDSTHTAIAWATVSGGGYQLGGVVGGGEGQPVAWSLAIGAREWLRRKTGHLAPARVLVVIETQAPDGPHSASVEELRRVRYHWEAVCELLGHQCEFVDPMVWMLGYCGRLTGRGAYKKEYQRRARQQTNGRTANEDQCAAFGILSWKVQQLGVRLTT